MSKAEIKSWIAAAEQDEDDDAGATFQWDTLHENWAAFAEYASGHVLTSSTKARIEFLQERLLPLIARGELELSQRADIFRLLTLTHSRYVDSTSREAVETALQTLVKRDMLTQDASARGEQQKLTQGILKWIAVESARLGKHSGASAPANQFVLLNWACALHETLLEADATADSTKHTSTLIVTIASMLDCLLDRSTRVKETLRKGAVVRSRRAMRLHADNIPNLISTLLAASKSLTVPFSVLPLLGLSIDVAIRLKSGKAGGDLILPMKNEIVTFYATNILMSKIPVPSHISTALHDFIGHFVLEEDLSSDLIPAIEKALVRSPEISMSVVSDFLLAYPKCLAVDPLRSILGLVVNGAKSNNAAVRNQSSHLFSVLVDREGIDDDVLSFAVTELIALPKASKTTGTDHRIALYTMLRVVKPVPMVAATVTSSVPSLLAKETSEVASTLLAHTLAPHMTFCLRENQSVDSAVITTIVREMSSSKPAIRNGFCTIAGNALWDLDGVSTDAARTFATALVPAFESSLKTVSNSPLNSVAGVLEGYVAMASLLMSVSRLGLLDYNDMISRNAVIQGVFLSSTKPHFLLWPKCYQRLTSDEEETWFLRALQASFSFFAQHFSKTHVLRVQIGTALVHLAVESKNVATRKAAVAFIQSTTPLFPHISGQIIRDALYHRLSHNELPSKSDVQGVERQSSTMLSGRLYTLLSASTSLLDSVDIDFREQELVESLVISHHPDICGVSRSVWVDICQRARLDPHHLIAQKADRLMELVWESVDTEMPHLFVTAGFRAVTTLTFVAPNLILPRLMEQLKHDLDPTELKSIGVIEYSIWKTPEGTLFTDVLSKRKEISIEKGKDAELHKWEAELRKSLATKKPANAQNLSKQDRAIVDAQLVKEANIRSNINIVKGRLGRGLRLVRSMIEANTSEFNAFITPVTSLLLSGVVERGAMLVGNDAFETYVAVADASSERLGNFRRWIGVSTLRNLEVDGIPEELTVEPLNQLTLRVLYRLRTQAEQSPFNSATYSYAAPLIFHVIATSGRSAADSDESLEQLSLALDFIRFHCSEFVDPAYPRLDTIKSLLQIIRIHPQLAQASVPSLVDLGEAIHLSATREETQALINGTLSQESLLRNACLQTLQAFDLTDLDWSPELWLACHDDDDQNSRLAHHVWEDNGLDVPENYLHDLLPLHAHDILYVRMSCSYATAEAAEMWPQSVGSVLMSLQDFYREKAKILAPEFDEYGMVIPGSLDRTDPWLARLAIARTLEALAPSFPEDHVTSFFMFLVSDALGDRHGEVRRGLLAAGTAVLDLHGPSHLPELISLFEENLKAINTSSETSDYVKEAVVILFGRLARHLDSNDPRIPQVVDRLVDALQTPAESVQVAVSDCLAPLVKTMKDSAQQLVDQLFNDMLSASRYGARRGAAYGMAGVIKGIGISGMKEFDVIGRLRLALEDKKHPEARQGAMFAFETFSATLGRLFEPYVSHLVPSLLSSFGDATPDVRDATQDAAKVIMANMSGYGVKLLLPSLLSGLDEKQWRTKKGSIELLGTMAFCAPTQLSLSLPTIIPRLTGVLTDSHAQVRTAANKSLKQFGEVISNPEIQSLVPILLKALVDPDKSPAALTALLKMSFAHYIDSSSLALVIPIVERGLRERSSETKRKAARIVGNMSSLTDPKDFVPYLSRLLPMVHVCLGDPVPEARATAAKALGTLVERLGEVHFPDLVPGLLRTLKTDTSGIDRQGAAQGLSEVLAGLGMERLEGLLPDIITNASSPRSHVKEGFMSLLVFLPATFGVRFQPHLPKIIQPILGGLADSEEVVREAALRAGRMIITNYSNRAIDLLLPELEGGMFDSSWRIRQSSVTLVGELLFKVAGISGKAEIEEEETAAEATAADMSRKALTEVLGQDRRDRILSSLYLVRQDGVSTVRQASIHVWKALVQNTPRTVREILHSITGQVVSLLASPGFEQQETAARTMGELCRKFGEKVLAEIIIILQTSSVSKDDRTREGTCLALSEILENTTDAQREGHEDELISMVRNSLVDDSANVRSASARAFDILQEALGARAIDQTIPTLLQALRQPGESSGTALQALKEVMNVRAGVVFPILIPTLLATPITAFNARALASLVTVAGSALSKRLTVILSALVPAIEFEEDEGLHTDITEAIRALLASISDAEGLNTLMLLLLGWAKHQSPFRRVSAMNLFATFCEQTDLDVSFYRVDWIRQLISLLDDRQNEVVEASWKALDVFVKSVSKEDLESLVVPLRRTIETTGAPGRHVPGFGLPKGLSPLLPVILAGLTTGSNEQREQAAYAIGDLVERTEEEAMKPFVVPMTGPLIRVATQSTTYPAPVKSAILTALTTMLEKIPQFVKPFFPQLQRTFVKAALDPTSLVVRSRAAVGLGTLMRSQPRVDPLVTELISGAKSNEEAVAASLVLSLAHVVKAGFANLSQISKDAAVELISDAFREDHDEHYTQAIAALFAHLSPFPELLRPIVDAHLLVGTPPSVLCSHIIRTTVENAPELFYTLSCVPSVVKKMITSTGENPSISRPARDAKELFRTIPPYVDDSDVQSLF